MLKVCLLEGFHAGLNVLVESLETACTHVHTHLQSPARIHQPDQLAEDQPSLGDLGLSCGNARARLMEALKCGVVWWLVGALSYCDDK
jgi:hypothetical protein